jgi:hypothetical protein
MERSIYIRQTLMRAKRYSNMPIEEKLKGFCEVGIEIHEEIDGNSGDKKYYYIHREEKFYLEQGLPRDAKMPRDGVAPKLCKNGPARVMVIPREGVRPKLHLAFVPEDFFDDEDDDSVESNGLSHHAAASNKDLSSPPSLTKKRPRQEQNDDSSIPQQDSYCPPIAPKNDLNDNDDNDDAELVTKINT